jgi:hypothetical protein
MMMEEEARRRQQAEEAERMRLFQQQQASFQQQPPPAYPSQPQIITQTVVVREESKIGRITVELVKCRDLKSQDVLTQKADPYAVIQVERQKERTRKVKHTLDPVFNERFKFYVSETYATVDICVFDSNMLLSDFFMGKVEYHVSKLDYGVPVEGWFPLQPLHTSGKAVGGEAYIKLLLEKG